MRVNDVPGVMLGSTFYRILVFGPKSRDLLHGSLTKPGDKVLLVARAALWNRKLQVFPCRCHKFDKGPIRADSGWTTLLLPPDTENTLDEVARKGVEA